MSLLCRVSVSICHTCWEAAEQPYHLSSAKAARVEAGGQMAKDDEELG